jgi:hypothetical protein
MTTDKQWPDFEEFSRWLSQRSPRAIPNLERQARLQAAACAARDEFLAARHSVASLQAVDASQLEVLQLLAAADQSEVTNLPAMTTARGFTVTLAFDEGEAGQAASICILVQSPLSRLPSIVGETVSLWIGRERFELGQFDADGKALGTLPAGIQVTLADFAQGRVQLEEPPVKE